MRRIVLLLAILAFLLHVQPAQACRCLEPSPRNAYKRADSVAQVRIDIVSAPSPDGTVTAQGEIIANWKKKLPSRIDIVTGEDCAYPLKARETYILFLSKGSASWGTYKCRGNRVLREAGETVRRLQRYGTPTKQR
jgi:hypothetical protein